MPTHRVSIVQTAASGGLTDDPVAEIVQCGEPFFSSTYCENIRKLSRAWLYEDDLGSRRQRSETSSDFGTVSPRLATGWPKQAEEVFSEQIRSAMTGDASVMIGRVRGKKVTL